MKAKNNVKDSVFCNPYLTIPTPRFVTFYNGRDTSWEERTLKLSDMFRYPLQEPELELKVKVINVNIGCNIEFMNSCSIIHEYAQFQDRIAANKIRGLITDEAVEEAVQYCISHDILRDFLMKNREAAMSVSIYEFDEVLYEKTLREESMEEGIAIGEARGETRGKAMAQKAMITSFAAKHNISVAEAVEEFDLSEDDKAELLQSCCE